MKKICLECDKSIKYDELVIDENGKVSCPYCKNTHFMTVKEEKDMVLESMAFLKDVCNKYKEKCPNLCSCNAGLDDSFGCPMKNECNAAVGMNYPYFWKI